MPLLALRRLERGCARHPRVDPGPAGLLASGRDAPIAEHRGNARLAQRDAVLRAPVDVLVLAACEDAMSERQAADLRARAGAVPGVLRARAGMSANVPCKAG